MSLHDSSDGVGYTKLCDLRVSAKPNEATIRFLGNGRARMIVRREAGDRQAWIGDSQPPYRSWTWKACGYSMGGPNFIVLPDGTAWAAGRTFVDGIPRVTLGA